MATDEENEGFVDAREQASKHGPRAPESEPSTLEQVLDGIEAAAHGKEHVTLDNVLDASGRRSFGPLLLLVGLITLAPVIGDIPGVPTIMSAIVILTSVQLLLGRSHFWLPGWLLRRSIAPSNVHKALRWLRKPSRFIDRLLRPRLTGLVQGPGVYAIALVSLVTGLAMPVMEFVPFSANGAGVVLVAFGLALITRDGLLALPAFALAAATAAILVYNLAAG